MIEIITSVIGKIIPFLGKKPLFLVLLLIIVLFSFFGIFIYKQNFKFNKRVNLIKHQVEESKKIISKYNQLEIKIKQDFNKLKSEFKKVEKPNITYQTILHKSEDKTKEQLLKELEDAQKEEDLYKESISNNIESALQFLYEQQSNRVSSFTIK